MDELEREFESSLKKTVENRFKIIVKPILLEDSIGIKDCVEKFCDKEEIKRFMDANMIEIFRKKYVEDKSKDIPSLNVQFSNERIRKFIVRSMYRLEIMSIVDILLNNPSISYNEVLEMTKTKYSDPSNLMYDFGDIVKEFPKKMYEKLQEELESVKKLIELPGTELS